MTPAELDEAVERLLDQAEDQGFGRHVCDPDVLDRIAQIVVGARPTNASEAGPETGPRTTVPTRRLEQNNAHGT